MCFFPRRMIWYHILFIHRAEQPDLCDGQTLIYPVYGISQQFKGTRSRDRIQFVYLNG